VKWSFVVSVSGSFLFPLNCTINAMKFCGTNAEFHIIYNGITQEVRDSYNDAFPFKIIWHDINELWNSLNITAKVLPNPYWVTTWYLASKLIDDYDAIAILQADEFLMTNINSLFKVAAQTDIVVATEYTLGPREFEDLPFGTIKSLHDRGEYALYDQLVICGKANKQIFIDTYQQQCVDPWKNSFLSQEIQDPLCALNQACSTHLNTDRVLGLDAMVWAYDDYHFYFKLQYDREKKRLYNDRKIRLHGIHTKVWSGGVINYAINGLKQDGQLEKADLLIHNYSLERSVMLEYNNMTSVTKNNLCTEEKFE
jgi:hypothetical protein